MPLSYNKIKTTFCIGNEKKIKLAALYFDSVLPLTFCEYPKEILPVDYGQSFIQGFLTSINLKSLPLIPELRGLGCLQISKTPIAVTKITGEKVLYWPNHLETSDTKRKIADKIIEEAYMEDRNNFRTTISSTIKKSGIQNLPILTSDNLLPIASTIDEDINFCLSNIDIINVEHADWEQILEFRKDKDSQAKLRRFKLFFYENLFDKSMPYIEDYLLKSIDDYEQAIKRHGFQSRFGTLKLMMDSKFLLTTMATTIGFYLFGRADIAAASLAGFTLEIGKCSLNLAKSKYTIRDFKNNHDLAYIIKAQENFDKKVKTN